MGAADSGGAEDVIEVSGDIFVDSDAWAGREATEDIVLVEAVADVGTDDHVAVNGGIVESGQEIDDALLAGSPLGLGGIVSEGVVNGLDEDHCRTPGMGKGVDHYDVLGGPVVDRAEDFAGAGVLPVEQEVHGTLPGISFFGDSSNGVALDDVLLSVDGELAGFAVVLDRDDGEVMVKFGRRKLVDDFGAVVEVEHSEIVAGLDERAEGSGLATSGVSD